LVVKTLKNLDTVCCDTCERYKTHLFYAQYTGFSACDIAMSIKTW